MKDCVTGSCPVTKENEDFVRLSEGSGGKEMHRLISSLTSGFFRGGWKNTTDDSASIRIGDTTLLFTTDSFIVTPLFFPGGDIGKLAFCGTVNDLAVMGGIPLGISSSLVIEEGFPKESLGRIIDTLRELSEKHKIPIVTGDTKVMERKSIDGLIINTSGIAIANTLFDRPVCEGDRIIVSGGIGEHGAALLAKRFELMTDLLTDSKPLIEELQEISHFIKQAKDITRGGLASILNELAEKNSCEILVQEKDIPVRKEVKALTDVLGIDAYSLACEGRFACICSAQDSPEVIKILRKHNAMASVIGEIRKGKNVILQTIYGKKLLSSPSGNIVPRIC